MKKIPELNLDLSRLKVGDVILVHTYFKPFQPVSWLAWFIRFFQRNYWNHAAIIDITDNGSVLIVQALAKGIEASFFKDHIIGKEIQILRLNSDYSDNPLFIESVRNRIIKGIGVKYDYAGCLIFQLFHQIGEMINPDSNLWLGKKGSKAANRFYCSEFVAWCLDLPNWWLLAPDDLNRSHEFKEIFLGKVISINL